MAPSLNLWAVLAAAVVQMVIGSVWYGPLFGKQWMGMSGLTKESMRGKSAGMAMLGGFVTALVTAYVLAYFVDYVGAIDAASSFALAFWIWLGFMATLQAGSVLWEGKPFRLFLLNTAQSFVALYAMTLVLAYWA